MERNKLSLPLPIYRGTKKRKDEGIHRRENTKLSWRHISDPSSPPLALAKKGTKEKITNPTHSGVVLLLTCDKLNSASSSLLP